MWFLYLTSIIPLPIFSIPFRFFTANRNPQFAAKCKTLINYQLNLLLFLISVYSSYSIADRCNSAITVTRLSSEIHSLVIEEKKFSAASFIIHIYQLIEAQLITNNIDNVMKFFIL